MTVETLTTGAAAILLDAGEWRQCDDKGQLCALVRQAQRVRGLPVWKSMDTRMFVSGVQALLLAWPTEVQLFSFPDFETLLHGALHCPEEPPSALLCLRGTWYLLLRCVPGHTPGAMYEFGTPEEADEGMLIHLREHGEVPIPADAISRLHTLFGKK